MHRVYNRRLNEFRTGIQADTDCFLIGEIQVLWDFDEDRWQLIHTSSHILQLKLFVGNQLLPVFVCNVKFMYKGE